jgi:hypothetical protein
VTGYSISARKALIFTSSAGTSKVTLTFRVFKSALTDCTPCSSPNSVSIVWVQCEQCIEGTEYVTVVIGWQGREATGYTLEDIAKTSVISFRTRSRSLGLDPWMAVVTHESR